MVFHSHDAIERVQLRGVQEHLKRALQFRKTWNTRAKPNKHGLGSH
jgi:hypothetical protein